MRRFSRPALIATTALVLTGGITLGATAANGPIFLPLISARGPLPLQVPAGFTVELYASGLNAPRLMDVGPDGALYVAERGANAVVKLADTDRDGIADGRVVVAQNLASPNNVSWYDGRLYVGETGRVDVLEDTNGDGDFLDAGEVTLVTNNIPGAGGHSSRTAHVGPDGKLYVAAGSVGNIEPETDRRRATIMRFNLDGSIPADNPFANDSTASRRPVWAEGLRNSVDFLFTADGKLWANHNGSDGLGNDNPPEEIVIDVQKGKHYGWPYCYTPATGKVPAGTGEVRDNRVTLAAPVGSCNDVQPALFTDLAHQAPLGMVQYGQGSFPAAMHDDLFVAYHGSWNTDNSANRDCRVQRIIVENGVPVGAEPFLTGFRQGNEKCGSAWGRPAGVAVGAAGELYVSDDKNGNIYRIVYTGK